MSITSLVILEVLTRLVFMDIGTTGDNASYFSRRWHAEHPPLRNALAFREVDFAPIAPPGLYRIVIVGDSFIYGQGILEFERLSNRLEQRLNASGRHFEVLNFGDPGADYEKNTINTELAITHAHPDFVLLSWYENDVIDPGEPNVHPYRLAWKLHNRLNWHSALYYVMNNAFARLQSAAGLDPYRAALRVHSAGAEDRLRRLLAVPRRRHLPFGMILWRHPSEEGVHFAEQAGLIAQVLAVCAEHEITCLDLGPTLVEYAANDRLVVNRFDHHPNSWANALAAEATLAAFAPVWEAAAEAKRIGAVAPGT